MEWKNRTTPASITEYAELHYANDDGHHMWVARYKDNPSQWLIGWRPVTLYRSVDWQPVDAKNVFEAKKLCHMLFKMR